MQTCIDSTCSFAVAVFRVQLYLLPILPVYSVWCSIRLCQCSYKTFVCIVNLSNKDNNLTLDKSLGTEVAVFSVSQTSFNYFSDPQLLYM